MSKSTKLKQQRTQHNIKQLKLNEHNQQIAQQTQYIYKHVYYCLWCSVMDKTKNK